LWRADDDGISARDSELQAKVFEELGAEPGLDPSRLKVAVKRGAVTLSGTVGNEPERVAAERAARRLRGVQVVSNHISVGTTLMSRWSGASA
jgi:osmotically-inducible protein OsmY